MLLSWQGNTATTGDGAKYTIRPLPRQDDGYILALPDQTEFLGDHPGYCQDEAERHYAASLVQPLDWQGDGTEASSSSHLGAFHIYSDGRGDYRAVIKLDGLTLREERFRSRDEAKSFCQWYYASLVLSCLNVCRDEYP